MFTPVENQDVNHNLLQNADLGPAGALDEVRPPGNGYPFIDFGNRYIAGTYL